MKNKNDAPAETPKAEQPPPPPAHPVDSTVSSEKTQTESHNQTATAKEKLDRDLVRYTGGLTLFTALLVVAAGLQFWAMMSQLGEMKTTRISGDAGTAAQLRVMQAQSIAMSGQLEQMKVTSDILRDQTKADIGITINDPIIADNGGWWVTPSITNRGGSIAPHVVNWDTGKLFTVDPPNNFDFSGENYNATNPYYFTLPKGDSRDLVSIRITKADALKIKRGASFIIWGVVEYFDIFKTKHHQFFCLRAFANDNPAPHSSAFGFTLYRPQCNSGD